MKEWKKVTSRVVYGKPEYGVEKYKTVGAYGPGMGKATEKREAIRLK